MLTRTLLAVLTSIAAFASAAQACSCTNPTLEQMLEWSDAVFTGKVFKIELENSSTVAVSLDVDSCWKGTVSDTVRVVTGLGDADCGYSFRVAESYLVFAYGSPNGLATDLCTRTAPVSWSPDLAELGPPTGCEVAVSPTIWGAIKKLYLSIE